MFRILLTKGEESFTFGVALPQLILQLMQHLGMYANWWSYGSSYFAKQTSFYLKSELFSFHSIASFAHAEKKPETDFLSVFNYLGFRLKLFMPFCYKSNPTSASSLHLAVVRLLYYLCDRCYYLRNILSTEEERW